MARASPGRASPVRAAAKRAAPARAAAAAGASAAGAAAGAGFYPPHAYGYPPGPPGGYGGYGGYPPPGVAGYGMPPHSAGPPYYTMPPVPPVPPVAPVAPKLTDAEIGEKINRLKDFRDRGVITQANYDVAVGKILLNI